MEISHVNWHGLSPVVSPMHWSADAAGVRKYPVAEGVVMMINCTASVMESNERKIRAARCRIVCDEILHQTHAGSVEGRVGLESKGCREKEDVMHYTFGFDQ